MAKLGTGTVTEIGTRPLTHIEMMKLAPYLEKSDNELADLANTLVGENPAIEKATDEDDSYYEGNESSDDDRRDDDDAKNDGESNDDEGEGIADDNYEKEQATDPDDYDSNPDDEGSNNNDSDDWKSISANNRSADDEYYTPTAVNEESLEEFLMKQLGEREDVNERQLLIAEYVIGSLDNNGWLTRTPSAIADDVTFKESTDVDTSEVKDVISIIHELDPAGVAATTVRECLLLQIDRLSGKNPYNLIAYNIVDRYLEDFSKKHFEKICKALDIDKNEYLQAALVIKKLNPRPGAGYSSGSSDIHREQITPDFEITVDDDIITCTLPNRIPELVISESYQNAPKIKALHDNETVMRQYKEANEFIRMLKMRQEKLFAVMKSIIKHQRAYFLSGDENEIRPLTYKAIEQDTGLDYTIISRACKGKYAQTPWGVFRLRHFFSEAYNDDVSTRTVKIALKEIVDEEDKSHPYSDDRLCEKLKERGFEISRRTVAKYREQLKIADSRLRRDLIVNNHSEVS